MFLRVARSDAVCESLPMPLSDDDLRAAVLAHVTSEQRHACVVYVASGVIARGSTFTFPGVTIELPWTGFLAFIDLDPMANWTHPCRYVCIDAETAETKTIDAMLPPFGSRHEPSVHWRELYRAPDVPDTVAVVAPGARSERDSPTKGHL
jgi:hypothetical protein